MTFALHPSTGWVFDIGHSQKIGSVLRPIRPSSSGARCFEVLQRCIAQALRVALPTLRFYDDVPCEQLTSLVRFDLANTLAVEGLQSGPKAFGSDDTSGSSRRALRSRGMMVAQWSLIAANFLE